MKTLFTFRIFLPALAGLAALAALGCSKAAVIKEPELPPLFGEEVDSFVVEPFRVASGAKSQLNDVDIKLFQELLTEQLLRRPFLRVFPGAPTELSNTIVLEGELVEFDVRDLPGEEVFLREIQMVVELRARPAGGTGAAKTIRRDFSFQKVYLPSDTIPVASFDLRAAASELTEVLAEVMYPSGIAGDLPLAEGIDPDNGMKLGHPLLARGNRFAVSHRFGRARSIWRYLLFDPSLPGDEPEDGEVPEQLFRISRRTLHLLRREGMEEQTLKKLEPLTAEEPEDLVEFRKLVRAQLGGFTPAESAVLNAADHRTDRRHLNLAAAHRNLAVLYWLESRYDRAVYHLARAYANYPDQDYLSKWAKIQRARKLIPEPLSDEEAITLFLRLPPPRGMLLEPGSSEGALFTPVVFEEPENATAQEGEGTGADSGREAEGEADSDQKSDSGGEVDLKPVERAPVERDGQPADGGLPPIEAVQKAQ